MLEASIVAGSAPVIRTPDQRLRVFVSSTLQELAEERAAAREAIANLRLAPVMFELGARPHPPRDVYRAYLEQSHIFVGLYWQKYGWVAPGESISGLEDEYRLSGDRPKLIYIKSPAPDREPRLVALLEAIKGDDRVSYKPFRTAAELRALIADDLAMVLTEHFEQVRVAGTESGEGAAQRPTNVPTPRSPLVDRQPEMATARSLLLDGNASLLTLTGPGGTGKSRLGLHLALDLLDHFEDGAFLVRLTPISEPGLVISTIAETLGVRERAGGQPMIETLKTHLRDKRVLLLLDCFEHLLPAAPLVGELLESCPRLKIIVTSRAPLRLRAERELMVMPLAAPEPQAQLEPARLMQSPAVALFAQRAESAKPDFAITPDNLAVIAEICRRLDGLPLAIELAAARIKLLSPQALLARLERRLDLLKSNSRDVSARQRTLRNAIGWSYELLDPEAQKLFRRLSVFVSGWTLDAAEAVCNAETDPGFDVLDKTEVLINSSLLLQLAGSDDDPRFGMLETIREYARERLAESGEEAGLLRAHARYYLELVAEIAPKLCSAERVRWTNRLEAEHNNLRRVLAWSVSSDGDVELGLQLAGQLGWFWQARGHLSEGSRWLESLLNQPRATQHTPQRAWALFAAGGLTWSQGDLVKSNSYLAESVLVGREVGDLRSVAYALTMLAKVRVDWGQLDAARPLHTESVALLRQVQDRWGEAFALNFFSDTQLMLNDPAGARSLAERSLALWREVRDPWGVAQPTLALAAMDLVQGDDRAARPRYEEAIALFQSVGDRWGLSWAVSGLAQIVLKQGDVLRACELLRQSAALCQEVNNRAGLILFLTGMASASAMHVSSDAADSALRREGLRRAARLLGAADALRDRIGGMLWHTSQVVVDLTMSAIRPLIEESSFAAAWQEGRALPIEQAIAEALSNQA